MDQSLTTIERLCGRKATLLVHAPFAHAANLTPYKRFAPTGPYEFGRCAGADVALYATPDKAETLDLWARIVESTPASLTIVWPNDQGGKGLTKHLQAAGLPAVTIAKHHARLAALERPAAADGWRALPATVPGTRLKSCPGLFSWRTVDDASALLAAHLPDDLGGAVADFGCGWGFLSDVVLTRCPQVTALHAIDDDVRAAAMTKDNVDDARLHTHWLDLTRDAAPGGLDAVVMNPPFHHSGAEDRGLGVRFIERAAASLKPGGALYIVANRHLPYERALTASFGAVETLADRQGFKVIKGVRT